MEVEICRFHSHPSKYFCVKCETVACGECANTLHKDHTKDTLENTYKLYNENARSSLQKIQSEETKQRSLEELNGLKEKIKNAIETRSALFKTMIDERHLQLTNELKKWHKDKELQIDIDINQEKATLEHILGLKDVRQLVTSMNRVGQISNQTKKYAEGILFQEGHITDDEIQRYYGHIIYEKNTVTSPTISSNEIKSIGPIQILKSENIDIRSIDAICPIDDRSTWIVSREVGLMQNITNDTFEYIDEFNIRLRACCASGDGLVCVNTERQLIKFIDGNKKVKDLIDLKPLFPLCVHVTSSKDIIVGVVENETYSLEKNSRRLIQKYAPTGELKKEYEVDVRKVRIFTQPTHCFVNETTNDIVVVDRKSSSQGRVICLRQNGEVKFRYNGCRDKSTKFIFNPVGVVCLRNASIVVLDYCGGLHCFDKNGENKKYFSIPVEHPSCLTVALDDRLWIGSRSNHTNDKTPQVTVISID